MPEINKTEPVKLNNLRIVQKLPNKQPVSPSSNRKIGIDVTKALANLSKVVEQARGGDDPVVFEYFTRSIASMGQAFRIAKNPAVYIIKRDLLDLFETGLKHLPSNDPEKQLAELMQTLFTDKGFDLDVVKNLNKDGVLTPIFNNFVLRTNDSRANALTSYWISSSLTRIPLSLFDLVDKKVVQTKTYLGLPEDNEIIDGSIKESSIKNDPRRQFSGKGATRIFFLGINPLIREKISSIVRDTSVIVIGGGPAGLMVTRGLIELGFDGRNITVIDSKGKYKGIWEQKNVSGGSKNNPFRFEFENQILDPAPGSGQTVVDFLDSVEDYAGRIFNHTLPIPIKGSVVKVEPGNLQHKVIYITGSGEHEISSPIVINAIGNGRPLYPSREGVMTTDTPDKAGIRWQKIITPEVARSYSGKTLVFIGLGNSTAEMLIQINEFNKQGYKIDYRVLTHYPFESTAFPEVGIDKGGKTYRVFRDITVPNLTKWEGDLPDPRNAYFTALSRGKIISDVIHWSLTENNTLEITKRSGEQQKMDCHQLFTLIGYGQPKDLLENMGMKVTDEYLGTVAYDYDGEIQREPGTLSDSRIYKGYYGLGSVLKSAENQNAVVMPGIMHRMYDLLFGVIIRAAEHGANVNNK